MSDKLQQDHHKGLSEQKVIVKLFSSNIGESSEMLDTISGGINYMQGRGAQFNTPNRFQKNELTTEHIEGIDD